MAQDFITKIHELPIASDRAKADIAGNAIIDTYATKTESAKVSVSEGATPDYLGNVLKAGNGITLTETNGVISASVLMHKHYSLGSLKATRPILYEQASNSMNMFSLYVGHNEWWHICIGASELTESSTNIIFYVRNLNSSAAVINRTYVFQGIRAARVWSSETDWKLVIYCLTSNTYSATHFAHTIEPCTGTYLINYPASNLINLDIDSAYKVDFLPIKWINRLNSNDTWTGTTEVTTTTSDETELNPEQGSTELSQYGFRINHINCYIGQSHCRNCSSLSDQHNRPNEEGCRITQSAN